MCILPCHSIVVFDNNVSTTIRGTHHVLLLQTNNKHNHETLLHNISANDPCYHDSICYKYHDSVVHASIDCMKMYENDHNDLTTCIPLQLLVANGTARADNTNTNDTGMIRV
jgi:hypothetical protein